jgi:alkanesulfonate monooxygenase SsuD/methylene tetrahydromethanopterin reductase-like flavin-dependent oxidoreductase (luciferase family)
MISRLDGAVAGVVVHIHAPMIPHAAAPVSRFSDLDVKRGNAMRVFTRLPMRDWRETQQAARDAEAAGFDAVMTVELGHDVFAPLAVAALATERVELTPSVAVAFPRSPTVLASQAWDLQANSRGRFVLGLGSQVKGHNERRFGIAWTAPAPRLRDYVLALRALWRCWETGEKLDFHSEHYTLTLMTPDFSPEPTGLPMVPVTLAAVGEAMLRVAGQVADGVRLHPLCSRRYLEECACRRSPSACGAAGGRENFDMHRRQVRRHRTGRREGGSACRRCDGASASTARREPTCRSWRCMDCRIWG